MTRTFKSSGFLPTYDVVGIPTMSYLPDVAYDVVGQDLRCRMSTTSYVMTYDIDIRHRMCPTYDVVTYDVHTISSKRTMSYVQTTMSYGFHRMRYRRSWTEHRMLNQLYRMRHRIRCLRCFRSGDPYPYCCILRSHSDCFLHCSVLIAVHSPQIKPAPLRPSRRLGGSSRLSSCRTGTGRLSSCQCHRLSSCCRLCSSSTAGCLIILVVCTFRHCIALIDRSSALDSNNIADCRFP